MGVGVCRVDTKKPLMNTYNAWLSVHLLIMLYPSVKSPRHDHLFTSSVQTLPYRLKKIFITFYIRSGGIKFKAKSEFVSEKFISVISLAERHDLPLRKKGEKRRRDLYV